MLDPEKIQSIDSLTAMDDHETKLVYISSSSSLILSVDKLSLSRRKIYRSSLS